MANRDNHYEAAFEEYLRQRQVPYVAVDEARRAKWADGTLGTFGWSAQIAGVSLTDPLAGAEAISSSRSFYGPLMISLLIPIIITVLLGRVFCGWICPMNTLLEMVDKLRPWLSLAEIRERDLRFSRALPMLAGMICFSIFSLWLLKQPMEMRTSAM